MDRKKQNDYMYRLAERNKAEEAARLCEPRVLWDVFTFDGSTQRVYAPNPDTFRNGERFPLRITHVMTQMLYEDDDQQQPVGGDERMVQRYGLRIRAHGTYYQNSEFTPLPLYANYPVAASDVASQAQATWRLNHPFLIGNRDTFQAEVRLLVAPAVGSDRVTVSFQGVGFYSRQPKILTGAVELSDTSKGFIDTNDLRNDGTEPFELHQIIVHHAPDTQTANPIGNVRNVRVRIRANGNGTSQEWVVGPKTGAYSDQLVPAPLLGTDVTRAVPHRLPGKGWLWYPGEGVDLEMRSFTPTREETVVLAMVGHIMVL